MCDSEPKVMTSILEAVRPTCRGRSSFSRASSFHADKISLRGAPGSWGLSKQNGLQPTGRVTGDRWGGRTLGPQMPRAPGHSRPWESCLVPHLKGQIRGQKLCRQVCRAGAGGLHPAAPASHLRLPQLQGPAASLPWISLQKQLK